MFIPGLKPEEIRDFFIPLTTNNNRNGELFMQRDDLEYFLGYNFQGFTRPITTRLLNPNMRQVEIRVYVARFYLKYCKGKIKTEKFAFLLRNTFLQCIGTSVKTFKANLVKQLSSQDYLFKDLIK